MTYSINVGCTRLALICAAVFGAAVDENLPAGRHTAFGSLYFGVPNTPRLTPRAFHLLSSNLVLAAVGRNGQGE